MINYQPLYQTLSDLKDSHWLEILPEQISQAFELNSNGNAAKWLDVIEKLPQKKT